MFILKTRPVENIEIPEREREKRRHEERKSPDKSMGLQSASLALHLSSCPSFLPYTISLMPKEHWSRPLWPLINQMILDLFIYWDIPLPHTPIERQEVVLLIAFNLLQIAWFDKKRNVHSLTGQYTCISLNISPSPSLSLCEHDNINCLL